MLRNLWKRFYHIICFFIYRNYKILAMIYYVTNPNVTNTFLKYVFQRQLLSKNSIIIGESVQIGEGLKLPHPINIVIGKKVIIGNNCTLYHNVTMGQKNNLYPRIGNNVTIYPGANIIGNINIGDNAIIGAGAVVTRDVMNNTIVAGNPARVIKE